jgi:hypothetical protein
MGRFNIIMMLTQCNFNPNPNGKILELDKLILKFIWKTKHMCTAKKLGRKNNQEALIGALPYQIAKCPIKSQ